MASASNYLREALMESVLLNVPFSTPVDLYLALFTTSVDADSGGDEVTGGSYEREVITFISTGTDGEASNNSMSFTDMPEVTVVGLRIMDSAVAGNPLYWANFSPVSVEASDTYPVDAGTLIIRHL